MLVLKVSLRYLVILILKDFRENIHQSGRLNSTFTQLKLFESPFAYTLVVLFYHNFLVLYSRKHQRKSLTILKQLTACNFDKVELHHISIPKYLLKVLQELYLYLFLYLPANIYTVTHSLFTTVACRRHVN